MPTRLSISALATIFCLAGLGVTHAQTAPGPEGVGRPDFAVVKQRVLTRLANAQSCVSAAADFRAMHGCFPHAHRPEQGASGQ